MRLPDPRPMPLTERARVLREVATFERLVRRVRTKPLPRREHGRGWAARDMRCDLGLCDALGHAIQRGLALASRLTRSPRLDIYRPSPEVRDLLNLAYAVKADFFQTQRDADAWTPT